MTSQPAAALGLDVRAVDARLVARHGAVLGVSSGTPRRTPPLGPGGRGAGPPARRAGRHHASAPRSENVSPDEMQRFQDYLKQLGGELTNQNFTSSMRSLSALAGGFTWPERICSGVTFRP
jgi:hypothetical protein